jgi:hypothetical protein
MWQRWKLGWLADSDVYCIARRGVFEVTLSLGNEEWLPEAYRMITVRLTNQLAFVIEARRNVGRSDGCGDGVLMYTIWTVTNSGYGPIQLENANPNSAGCGGDKLNAAPLNLGPNSAPQTYSSRWGVNVTLQKVTGPVPLLYIVKVTYD